MDSNSRTGLDTLPDDLRAALLSFLEPDEHLLWVGQPGPAKVRSFGDLAAAAWSMLGFKLLCAGPLIIGLGGIYDAIRLWVPGGTLPLIVQLVAFGILTLLGIGFTVITWQMKAESRADLARTVYAITNTRVLGFVGDPTVAYRSWWIWHTEAPVKTRRIRADGSGDVAFPTVMTRGHAFEGDSIFARIPGAQAVASLVEDAISQASP